MFVKGSGLRVQGIGQDTLANIACVYVAQRCGLSSFLGFMASWNKGFLSGRVKCMTELVAAKAEPR